MTPVEGPDGRTYPSIAAATKALGFTHKTIAKHLDRYGDLTRLGTHLRKVVTEQGEFESIAAASRALGISCDAVVWRYIKAPARLAAEGSKTIREAGVDA